MIMRKMVPHSLRLVSFLAYSVCLMATSSFPVSANTPPAPAQPQHTASKTFLPGTLDAEAFNQLAKADDPNQNNIAALMKFVDNESNIAGGLKACDASEYRRFVECSRLVLVHWNKVTGSPLPVLSYESKDTEEIVGDIWGEREAEASDLTMKIPQKCSQIVALSHQSKIWRYCSHPKWDKGATSGEDSSTTAPDQDLQ